MPLKDQQEKMCSESTWDFTDLKALFLYCTLKLSPELSHTQGLIDISTAIFEKNGCKVFVDYESLDYLKGTLVDYSEDGLNKGIKFVNPNAIAVCGCGESFTV